MKILYFWFEKYKDIKSFEANLGSEFIFAFKDNKLTVKNNSLYIENFFCLPDSDSTNNSIDISTIVGENGVGKSTLLDFVSDVMRIKKIQTKYILIYCIDKDVYLYSNFDQKVKIKVENFTNQSITMSNCENFKNNHLTILFSNIFDARSLDFYMENYNDLINKPSEFIQEFIEHEDEDYVNFRNISTNYLIREHSSYSYFLRAEFEKQIFFVIENKEQLNIKKLMSIPEKIHVEISIDLNGIAQSEDLIEVLRIFKSEYIEDYFIQKINNDFQKKFYAESLKCFFVHIELLLIQYGLFDFIDKFSYKDILYGVRKSKGTFKSIHDQIKENLAYDKNFEVKKKEKFFKELKLTTENFGEVCDLFLSLNFIKDNEKYSLLSDGIQTSEFILSYRKAFNKMGCLKFTWSNMSSGEYGMLSLFGRFHYVLNMLKKEVELFSDSSNIEGILPNSFLLLIDEGDLYFHPQWQKEWLSYFIKFIELLFKGKVQILITTHSPFVLSDFPSTNVIFLKKENAKVSSVQLEGSPKTFASNIVELFSNSFFIKDGLVGDFAKRKINNFIHKLLQLSPEEVYYDQVNIKKFIDLIGEPLIRNKIFQIYKDKIELYDSNYNVDIKIKYLEQEINRLKKERGM